MTIGNPYRITPLAVSFLAYSKYDVVRSALMLKHGKTYYQFFDLMGNTGCCCGYRNIRRLVLEETFKNKFSDVQFDEIHGNLMD